MVYEKQEDGNLAEIMSAYTRKKSDAADTAKRLSQAVPDLRKRVDVIADAYSRDLCDADETRELLSVCMGGIYGFKAKTVNGNDISATIQYKLGRIPVDISGWDERKLAMWLKTLKESGVPIEAHLGKGVSTRDYKSRFDRWLSAKAA